jgi:hypothetical protein
VCIGVFSHISGSAELLSKHDRYRRDSAKTTSIWLYLFFSNGIETLLVLPENESHQLKGAYHFAYSVPGQKDEL